MADQLFSSTVAHPTGDLATGDLEPLGVIDIGSNSVRLVVYEGAVRAPTPLFNEKILCGLGRSVATTGKLGEEPIARTLAALSRFKAIAAILRVKQLRAIATAAVRDAADGPAFIERGERACGVPILILSGEREAELAAQGIRMGFHSADGVAGDLGGGSLELIDVKDDTLKDAITLPLGGLRLIDTTGNKLDKALEFTDAQLGRMSWQGRGRDRTFYAVGGSWRALAKLHMEMVDYPLRVMQHYSLTAREAIDFCEAIRKGRRLPGMEDISKARRETLPYGALVMERVLKRLEPSRVVFSVFGIREGLLFSYLSAEEKARDPLMSFCEEYSRLRSRSDQHARELRSWTDGLFTGIEALKESPEERRLRHAACLLSDIGWRAHPDYRGEQSLNVIAHAALTGVDHPGRLFLALAIYFRHVGTGEQTAEDLSGRLKKLIDRRLLKRARVVGGAIRAAHMISIGMAGIIDKTRLEFENGKLILLLPQSQAAMNGERLARRFAQLGELIERQTEIRLVP